LENYCAGGSDKVAKLLSENLSFNKVFFFVNARNDLSVLESTPFNSNIELIKYNLITIAELGTFAKRFSNNIFLYNILRVFNMLIRYPYIIFLIFYFYFEFKKLNADIYISNNGGYPGGDCNRSSTVAATLIKSMRVYHLFHNIPTKAPLVTRIIENIYDRYLDDHAKFIGVADSIIADMYKNRNFKNKMIKISNGINGNKLKEYLDVEIVRFLNVGVLDDRKNQNLLIDVAIKLVSQNITNFIFIFMGKEGQDIGYKNNLIKKIGANNLQDNIKFMDFNNNPFSVYYNSDVFLLSSKVESLPIVSLEALSVGLPIISTKTGDTFTQVIDDYNGFLVEQNDISDYASKVKFFIENKHRIKEYGLNSYMLFSEKFTIDKMIDEYTNVLQLE